MDKPTWLEIEGGRLLPEDEDVDFVLDEEGVDYEIALFEDLCLAGARRRAVMIQSWGAALDAATTELLSHVC